MVNPGGQKGTLCRQHLPVSTFLLNTPRGWGIYFHASISTLLKLVFLSSVIIGLSTQDIPWIWIRCVSGIRIKDHFASTQPRSGSELPHKGLCPLDPLGCFAPLTIYPGATPGTNPLSPAKWQASLEAAST